MGCALLVEFSVFVQFARATVALSHISPPGTSNFAFCHVFGHPPIISGNMELCDTHQDDAALVYELNWATCALGTTVDILSRLLISECFMWRSVHTTARQRSSFQWVKESLLTAHHLAFAIDGQAGKVVKGLGILSSHSLLTVSE